MHWQYIDKFIFPGRLNTDTKFEGNPPSGWKVISKRKCRAAEPGGAGGPFLENFSYMQTLNNLFLNMRKQNFTTNGKM